MGQNSGHECDVEINIKNRKTKDHPDAGLAVLKRKNEILEFLVVEKSVLQIILQEAPACSQKCV